MQRSKIKVIIADDSVVYRSQIRGALESMGCEIVAAASNGRLAIDRLRLSPADLLVLDLEMPEMDGIQTLQELKTTPFRGKILVFSSQSQRGAEITMEALRLGATDFVAKPSATDIQDTSVSPAERIRQILEAKVLALFPQEEILAKEKAAPKSASYPQVVWSLLKPKIVVIGASTGGPTVLEKIFTGMNFHFTCPIVIVQHMPPVFTKAFAERITKISGHNAKEAEHGDVLQNNHIYIAPGNFHMSLVKVNDQVQISLDQSAQIHSVRPAVDKLFNSVAPLFKHQCLGVVLTGMGADGRDGSVELKKAGAAVVIQESTSCVVFGMPGAVYTEGAYDKIATPDEVIEIFRDKVMDTSTGTLPMDKKGIRCV